MAVAGGRSPDSRGHDRMSHPSRCERRRSFRHSTSDTDHGGLCLSPCDGGQQSAPTVSDHPVRTPQYATDARPQVVGIGPPFGAGARRSDEQGRKVAMAGAGLASIPAAQRQDQPVTAPATRDWLRCQTPIGNGVPQATQGGPDPFRPIETVDANPDRYRAIEQVAGQQIKPQAARTVMQHHVATAIGADDLVDTTGDRGKIE